jgi:hypothetical protein
VTKPLVPSMFSRRNKWLCKQWPEFHIVCYFVCPNNICHNRTWPHYFTKRVHKTSLTSPLHLKVPVQHQDSDRSCIYALGASFYDFCVGFWKCFDRVIFLFFILYAIFRDLKSKYGIIYWEIGSFRASFAFWSSIVLPDPYMTKNPEVNDVLSRSHNCFRNKSEFCFTDLTLYEAWNGVMVMVLSATFNNISAILAWNVIWAYHKPRFIRCRKKSENK